MSAAPTKPRFALVALAVLGVLALGEWVASAAAYRDRISGNDWDQAEEALPETAPIFVAEPWLEPAARMHLPAVRDWEDAAPPDLYGVPEFFVLGLDAHWSPHLEALREDLPPPHRVKSQRIGALTLHQYTQSVPVALGSLADWESVSVAVDGRGCSRRGDLWTCKPHRVVWRTAEIDYRARRCMAIESFDGTSVDIEVEGVELGDTVRGHLGFDDFNARLRSDAAARVDLLVDDETIATWVFTDDQGWAPFAARIPEPGTHDLTLRITASSMGTWTRKGYELRPAHAPCVELRTFQESDG